MFPFFTWKYMAIFRHRNPGRGTSNIINRPSVATAKKPWAPKRHHCLRKLGSPGILGELRLGNHDFKGYHSMGYCISQKTWEIWEIIFKTMCLFVVVFYVWTPNAERSIACPRSSASKSTDSAPSRKWVVIQQGANALFTELPATCKEHTWWFGRLKVTNSFVPVLELQAVVEDVAKESDSLTSSQYIIRYYYKLIPTHTNIILVWSISHWFMMCTK